MSEDLTPEEARRQALSFLARREQSAREVEEYLRRKGHDPETASRVTASLKGSGLVDDERLAEMVLRAAPARGWGRSRALKELLRRGLDAETAEGCLRRFYPEEDLRAALDLARKKWAASRGDCRRREEVAAGYLYRRGFSSSTVLRVLSELRASRPEDDGAG